MIKLNIHDAKTHLSKYLDLVEKGETILLCKRNVPVAEIRPVQKARKTKRPIGLGKGAFKIPKSFFDPLPKEIEDAFYGEEE